MFNMRIKSTFVAFFIVFNLCSCAELVCDRNLPHHCICERFTDDFSGFVVAKADCSFRNFENIDFDLFLNTEVLDLTGNNITEVTKITINHPSALQRLYLNRNGIRSISKNVFLELVNLEELDLTQNSIEFLESGSFAGLDKLKILSLASNNLTKLGPGVFQNMLQINVLILDYNNLAGFFENTPNVIEYLRINSSITKLSLKGTNIGFLLDDFFSPIPNLQKLNLAENNLERLPNLPRYLESLDISSNNLKNLSQNLNLPSLLHLYMNDLQNLQVIGDDDFRYLTNLQSLQAQNCKSLNVISPFMFGQSSEKSLSYMSFLGSGLSTLNDSLVDLFSRTDNLDLRGIPLQCTCSVKWILNLKNMETRRQYLRCKTPSHLAEVELFSLDEEQLCKPWPKDSRLVTTIALVSLCLVLGGLACWLVVLWKPTKVLTPQHITSYHPIQIQPNDAELT